LIPALTAEGCKLYLMAGPPSVENLTAELFGRLRDTLSEAGVRLVSVRIYETPNCWADFP
jgi:hypothetical protein